VLLGQPLRYRQRPIGGSVVGDDDAVLVGEALGQELSQRGQAVRQDVLFVVDGDDDVDGGHIA
jgi:hypothetical protein